MDVDKNLATFFNIDSNTEKSKNIEVAGNSAASEDYDFARENLKRLIATGSMGLEGILKVASESDSPRAYEVLATTLKTLADINVNLMDVSAKHAQATKVNVNNQTNNSIFVGTTKDLQALLKKETKIIEGEVTNVRENRLPNKSKS
jgi:hypothetical protein